eukprot:TRINITY_DN41260_c0_g1_i1.p1 TRINITY_DN41260_c0_g1~~TRINITY_DN41260_c0_g1_i1.p1  ORF type:complete len:416 (+),score=101.96 TRINITY_DN41260_c0_g1_i1:147-1394(+)
MALSSSCRASLQLAGQLLDHTSSPLEGVSTSVSPLGWRLRCMRPTVQASTSLDAALNGCPRFPGTSSHGRRAVPSAFEGGVGDKQKEDEARVNKKMQEGFKGSEDPKKQEPDDAIDQEMGKAKIIQQAEEEQIAGKKQERQMERYAVNPPEPPDPEVEAEDALVAKFRPSAEPLPKEVPPLAPLPEEPLREPLRIRMRRGWKPPPPAPPPPKFPRPEEKLERTLKEEEKAQEEEVVEEEEFPVHVACAGMKVMKCEAAITDLKALLPPQSCELEFEKLSSGLKHYVQPKCKDAAYIKGLQDSRASALKCVDNMVRNAEKLQPELINDIAAAKYVVQDQVNLTVAQSCTIDVRPLILLAAGVRSRASTGRRHSDMPCSSRGLCRPGRPRGPTADGSIGGCPHFVIGDFAGRCRAFL